LYKTAAIRSIYWVIGNATMRGANQFLDKVIILPDSFELATYIDSTFEKDNDFYFDKHFDIDLDIALSSVIEIAMLFLPPHNNIEDCHVNDVSFERVNSTTDFPDELSDVFLKVIAKLIDNLKYSLELIVYQALKCKIKTLKKQLPISDVRKLSDVQELKKWMQLNGSDWTEQLRAVMIEHRNIGYDWQFSDEQKQLLQQYYDANKLLVDCLNSDCYVSREVRQEIEETLLLSMLEIENRNRVNTAS
jgi:hypothetical protein